MMLMLLQAAGNGDDDFATSWPGAAVAIAGIALVTVIVAVAIWQIFGTWRSRMSVAREDAYRKLADETASVQARLAEQQEAIAGSLREISERLSGIETILREVG
jgi:transposase